LLSYDSKELYCFWEPELIDEATEKDLRDLKDTCCSLYLRRSILEEKTWENRVAREVN
jgi:hypothetical protein